MTCSTDGSYPMMAASHVRNLVKAIYREREFNLCWYDDENGNAGDCGNWSEGCHPDCPLRALGYASGLEPQDDGGVDKQPEVASDKFKDAS